VTGLNRRLVVEGFLCLRPFYWPGVQSLLQAGAPLRGQCQDAPLAPRFTLAFPRASGLIVTQQHGSMNSRATINHGDAGRRRGNPGASVCVAERRLIVARRFLVRCGPRLGSAAASRRFWTRRSRKRGTSFKSADLSATPKARPQSFMGAMREKISRRSLPGEQAGMWADLSPGHFVPTGTTRE